ncbi:MASE1 domain-containing protein [Corallococcus sp. BB11-1]|uniref:MASE1 domain-containing protein n=1 Tax=Corallococcus sp. BB11-1 TaxID=2996783 RepID=UPI002271FDE8|nr:MASE1 domain-containing protein [Corallococcus sp. BB11-1]MCY1036865.1 MASE1 domain-containing protein [Corallococcus sp. BB11-1]
MTIQARHQARVAAALQGGGLVEVIALAGVYLAAARAGLSLAAEGSHISAVWLPSGVALGGLLLWGVSRWPAVLLGAWTVALALDVSPLVGLGVAAGATLEAVLGALLLRRVACSRELHRVRDVVWLGGGAALCALLGSGLGSLSLVLGGLVPHAQWAASAWLWWMSNLLGMVLVTPPLLLLFGSWRARWNWTWETWVLPATMVAVCVGVFAFPQPGSGQAHALTFLLFPLSAWAALRCGPRGAALSSLFIALAAIAGTARGLGPFYTVDLLPRGLVVLQLFIGITSLTGLLLAAARAERREAVEMLELLATTVRAVHEGVLICEVREPGVLNTVFVNEALCALVGRRREELVGTAPGALLASPDVSEPRQLEDALREERSLRAEVVLQRPDGTRVWSEMQLSPVRANGEAVTHFVATHRDVTATKELQARLVAAERVAAVGTLAAGVGHEINNPLAYLALNLEAAQRSLAAEGAGAPAGVRDALGSVRGAQEGAERIRLIVRDLRVFSREESPEHGLVDLNALVPPAVRVVLHALRPRARLVESFGKVPRVLGSEARLGQVLLNLLVNAMQAIPEGDPGRHEVRVRTRTDAAGHACVEVEDTGGGIPPDVLPRIFDPFFTTKGNEEGTGLGLAICQQIIRAHGGELRVLSVPGQGATFTVLLPPATVRSAGPSPVTASSRQAARGAEAEEAGLPASSCGRRGRVLIVDDEPRLAQSMRLLLEPFHDVVIVTDGEAALARVGQGESFDVVLCDLQMPGMDGIAVYRRLVAQAPALVSRLVFISGGASSPEGRVFVETVANRVLEKPVRPDVLLATVEATLAGGGPPEVVARGAVGGARRG